VAAVVKVSGLRKAFGPAAARVEVLQGADLEVEPGEMVAVAGASGSGKSTLLHILGGLMHPDAGRVELDGQEVYRLRDGARAQMRNRKVGFVFQFHHLLAEFTALENIMMPALIAGRREGEARQRARELLDAMGLAARGHHSPGELSGGEQQRVAVARALVNDPEVVLADEPSGNLDEDSSQALHALLETLSRERQQAFVIATHSPGLARRARRTLLLQHGVLAPMVDVEGWV
jgi:lipoprotein-releasing system ATP-binding protein